MTNAEAYVHLERVKRDGKELSEDVFNFLTKILTEDFKRSEGCAWCKNNSGGKYLTETMEYNYCPKCGRKLRYSITENLQ